MATSRADLIKVPPYSVHSEKIVLASMLLTPALIKEIREVVPNGSVFFRPEHGRLFDCILSVVTTDIPPTQAKLVERLEMAGLLDKCGGAGQLRMLAESGEAQREAMQHARIVQDKARMRQLIDAISDIIHDAYHSEDGAEAVLARAKKRINALTRKKR